MIRTFFHEFPMNTCIKRNSITFPFMSKNRSKIIVFFTSSHKVSIDALDNCYPFEPFRLGSIVHTRTIYALLFRSVSRKFEKSKKIRTKSIALIPFEASKCLMIDESRIVSVNKLVYLLSSTRANIWPQIDTIPSAFGLIIDVQKLENFTVIHSIPHGLVCVCFSFRNQAFGLLFVRIIYVVVVGGVGVFHFFGFRTKLEQQMGIST